jgi:predicted heme/steroid binding protein
LLVRAPFVHLQIYILLPFVDAADSAWVAVDGKVYDVTEFLDDVSDHPPGSQ